MSVIFGPKTRLFWVLFVDFLADFFFRLFLGGGEKQRKGVVWLLRANNRLQGKEKDQREQ